MNVCLLVESRCGHDLGVELATLWNTYEKPNGAEGGLFPEANQ